MAQHKHLAVIPARGGSKRVPHKNIRVFDGKPMIAYAIDVARQSNLFERIVVSTDDQEIRSVALAHGAEVPFQRPADLSDDHAGTAPVLNHALRSIPAPQPYGYACCIYPCVPFLTADDLHRGLERLVQENAHSSFAVSEFDAPIWRAFREEDDGFLRMVWPEHEASRSQDLPRALHDAGQFYWVSVASFLAAPRLFTDRSVGVMLPRWRAHDIDTPEDWDRAELMFRALKDRL